MEVVAQEKARILIVEDNVQIRNLMSDLLDKVGYLTTSVGTITSALTEKGPWSLLILDRILPNGDGKRVAEHFEGVPTLYISGYEDADLRKPFNLKSLEAAVKERIK